MALLIGSKGEVASNVRSADIGNTHCRIAVIEDVAMLINGKRPVIRTETVHSAAGP